MSGQSIVFISYSRRDEKEKEALLTHLSVLRKDGLIDLWSDDQIKAGDTWQREIEQAMIRADAAILLVTANFLASDFIVDRQVAPLLQRRKREGLTVLPVIAKACAWQEIEWLRRMDIRPKHGQPVWRKGGSHVDDELTAIAQEVAKIIREKAGHGSNTDELIGTFLGRYQLIGLLGQGASQAKVYKTFHPGLNLHMAIKVMDSSLMSETALERFQDEAAAIARLHHNHIVRVYDFDHAAGKHYMVMDLIEGPTLEAKLAERRRKSQPFTLPETVGFINALAGALDYAHEQGVVHHDLKPANIMFTTKGPTGRLLLTDFGIARMMDAANQTIPGTFLGTPNYASPEQAQGQRGDKRSDIYSLGVILYKLVTGRLPYKADTSEAIIRKHIHEPARPPTEINPALPKAVEQVILKALSKNPDDRYQSAGALAASLRQVVFDTEPEPQQEPNKELIQETPDLSPVNSQFNLKELREKLTLMFDDAEFEAFCLDYFPQVYDKFSRGHRHDEKINLLLDYCRRDTTRQHELLTALE